MSAEPVTPLLPTVSLEPVYMTPAEVAAMLQVKSTKTIYDWASRKDSTMPVLRIGHTVRFPKARLLKWLEQREQGRPRPRRVQAAAKAQAAGS